MANPNGDGHPLTGPCVQATENWFVFQPLVSDVNYRAVNLVFGKTGKTLPKTYLNGKPTNATFLQKHQSWHWYSISLPIEEPSSGRFAAETIVEFRSDDESKVRWFVPLNSGTVFGSTPEPLGNSERVFPRVVYWMLYPQLFLAALIIVSFTSLDVLSLPQAVFTAILPVAATVLGQTLVRDLSLIKMVRQIYLRQAQSFILAGSLGALLLLGVAAFWEEYRIKWIQYRYNIALTDFESKSSRLIDPIEEFARLYGIAPERKENLVIFQHLLWRARYDDAFAKIVGGEAVGFKRAEVASRFLNSLPRTFREDLEKGVYVGCDCVDIGNEDDPRLVWFFARIESFGDITQNNISEFQSLVDYTEARAKETERSYTGDWLALSKLYAVVLYSHLQKDENPEFNAALKDLGSFIDSAERTRHSFLEKLLDQFAESNFIGNCSVDTGVEAYERIFRFRDFNNTSEVLREFPPEKLTIYRIISYLQGDFDHFNNLLAESLSFVCGKDGKSLEEIFRDRVFNKWEGNDILKRSLWRRNTPADPEILSVLSNSAKVGWN